MFHMGSDTEDLKVIDILRPILKSCFFVVSLLVIFSSKF